MGAGVDRALRPRPETAKGRRCGRVRGARIIMVPASMKNSSEREALSREIGQVIRRVRKRGGEVDPGLVRAKDAIDDEKNHLLLARSRWGEILGGLSYTFPDAVSIRVDYIGFWVHRCGLGRRLMAAVAEIALQGNRKITLTAQRGARGFFERLGMDLLEEYHDGNSAFEFSRDGMEHLLEEARRNT
jgi:hypothetical protein